MWLLPSAGQVKLYRVFHDQDVILFDFQDCDVSIIADRCDDTLKCKANHMKNKRP